MEQKKILEELNAECVLKLDEYLKSNKDLNEENYKKLHTAKEEWHLTNVTTN